MSDFPLLHVTDFRDVGIRRLLRQWQDRPRFRALMCGIGAGVQLLEDIQWQLLKGGLLPLAAGADLDVLGEIVGEERLSLIDDDYRRFIEARVLVNRSAGTAGELLAILDLLSAPNVYVQGWNQPPASYRLLTVRSSFMAPDVAGRVGRTMEEAAPAGKEAAVVEAVSGGFGFAGWSHGAGYGVGVFSRRLT